MRLRGRDLMDASLGSECTGVSPRSPVRLESHVGLGRVQDRSACQYIPRVVKLAHVGGDQRELPGSTEVIRLPCFEAERHIRGRGGGRAGCHTEMHPVVAMLASWRARLGCCVEPPLASDRHLLDREVVDLRKVCANRASLAIRIGAAQPACSLKEVLACCGSLRELQFLGRCVV